MRIGACSGLALPAVEDARVRPREDDGEATSRKGALRNQIEVGGCEKAFAEVLDHDEQELLKDTEAQEPTCDSSAA